MSLVYDIYSGDHSGGPIDYTTPVASGIAALTWVGSALPLSSTTRFGVRTRDTISGLVDLNTDATVTIVVSATGADFTNLPAPPQSIRAVALAGGAIRVEWAYPSLRGPRPTGFHIYQGIGSVNYTTPAVNVAYGNPLRTTITGLAGGTTYLFSVRAYSATGEEVNTNTATATAVTAGPLGPDNLTATATSVA